MSITWGQTNTTRYNYLYRFFGIRYLGSNSWQNSLKPVPSAILICLISLHMNEASLFMYPSYHAADKELVAGGEKYESRRGLLVGVPDIMACSFECTFSRCALMLLVVDGKLTVAYTACIQFYLEAPHFCRLQTKIRSITKRGFLSCLESKPLSLLPSWALNFPPLRFSLCRLHLSRFLSHLTFSGEWRLQVLLLWPVPDPSCRVPTRKAAADVFFFHSWILIFTIESPFFF